MPFAKDVEFQKLSPLGKIPALQDGDLTLCDSTVICEYLEDAYPDKPVYPANPKDKAKARWFEELGQRPALQRGMQVGSSLTQDYSKLSEEDIERIKALLYNQRARPAPETGGIE